MTAFRGTIVAGCLALAVAAVLAPAAVAAPPANDARDAAVALAPPATAQGTTAESTLEPSESPVIVGYQLSGSVWYRFTTQRARRVVIRLSASGDLDAAMELIRRSRSQFISEQQAITDEDGRATMVVDTRAGGTYFVRVAQRADSVPGSFKLELLVPEPPPAPPARSLPASGASG